MKLPYSLAGCILLLFAPVLLCAQDFQPGYVVLKSGQQQNALIEVPKATDTPNAIRWKRKKDGPVVTSDPSDLSLVEIENGPAFISASVSIDQSSTDPQNPSHQFAPEWEEQQVFLKTVSSGGVSLYEYRKGEKALFFLRMGILEPTLIPLVYKPYLTDAGELAYNESFRQQIGYLEGSDDCFSQKNYDDLSYTAASLSSHLLAYTACRVKKSNLNIVDYRARFRVWAQAGIGYTDLFQTLGDIGTHVGGEAGVLIEYVPSKTRGMFSVFGDFAFRYIFMDEATYALNRFSIHPAEVNYIAVDAVVGPRLYLKTGKDSRISIDVAAVLERPISSKLSIIRQTTTTYEMAARPNLAGSIGFQWRRFSLLTRYYLPREFLKDTSSLSGTMTLISFRLGVNIANKELY